MIVSKLFSKGLRRAKFLIKLKGHVRKVSDVGFHVTLLDRLTHMCLYIITLLSAGSSGLGINGRASHPSH